jgi:PAS domain S-box-containing protein
MVFEYIKTEKTFKEKSMSRPTPNDNEIEVKPVDIVVSKADEAGDIEYANPIFYKLSGYNKKELLMAPHSVLRHPDMPKVVFKTLWDELKNGNEVYAFVKNLTKDGSFYWVFAYVRPAFNSDGSLRNYVSTRKAMSQKAREVIEPFYKKLLDLEEKGGIEASEKELLALLDGRDFNTVMNEIQE